MSPEQEMATIDNAILFLKRSNLSGEEVIAFNQVLTYLIEKRSVVEAAAVSMQQSLDLKGQEETKDE